MEQPPSLPQLDPPVTQSAQMSLSARLLNVFAVPGEVFAELKAAPASAANWLVPAILLAVVGAISVVIIFSQPAILQQVREQQAKAMDQQVKAGKMSQADADKALAIIEKFTGPTMMKVSGGVAAVIVSFVRIVWWGLVLWLLGRWFFKTRFDYAKALEVAGLAMMINVLGSIVAVLLIVNLGRMGATPSLALAINDFDATRKSHLFMGAANVFSFWYVGAVAIGLAKLAGVPFVRAAFPVVVYWILQESLLIMIPGMGQMAL